jgi:putative flippase GtrA
MTRPGTLFRFAIVGLICAVAHNAILIGLDRWHVHYAVSCVVSFGVVVLLGYSLHLRFTFSEVWSAGSIGRYALSMAANYPIALALLFVMCDLAGWPVTVAAPASTGLMFMWNYTASRWAIVRKASLPDLPVRSRTS